MADAAESAADAEAVVHSIKKINKICCIKKQSYDIRFDIIALFFIISFIFIVAKSGAFYCSGVVILCLVKQTTMLYSMVVCKNIMFLIIYKVQKV